MAQRADLESRKKQPVNWVSLPAEDNDMVLNFLLYKHDKRTCALCGPIDQDVIIIIAVYKSVCLLLPSGAVFVVSVA